MLPFAHNLPKIGFNDPAVKFWDYFTICSGFDAISSGKADTNYIEY